MLEATPTPETADAPEPSESGPSDAAPRNTREAHDALTVDAVRAALGAVVDPELGINIVDLGLVYDVAIDDAGGVRVEYTLTTMGCPIGPLIEAQMQEALAKLPGFTGLRAELVFRPPWSPELMSEEAKAALGFF